MIFVFFFSLLDDNYDSVDFGIFRGRARNERHTNDESHAHNIRKFVKFLVSRPTKQTLNHS